MTKLTAEKIAKIVHENLVSAEIEAVDEINANLSNLTDAIKELTKVLATKKEPEQLEMFAEPQQVIITPNVVEQPKVKTAKPLKAKPPVVEQAVAPVVEPVVEQAVAPVVEPVAQEVITLKFLQTKIGGDFVEYPAFETYFEGILKKYKASSLGQVPEDCYRSLLNDVDAAIAQIKKA
jgi:hypothetical protein